MLEDCADKIEVIRQAAKENGIEPKILIDMQGPELRIGRFEGTIELAEGDILRLGQGGIPLDAAIISQLEPGLEVLLDDGRILAKVIDVSEEKTDTAVSGYSAESTTSGHAEIHSASLNIIRGGTPTRPKRIKLVGKEIPMPALTSDDKENLKHAAKYGITGIMQPFVRSRDDLLQVKEALRQCGCGNIQIYAKVENLQGVDNLESFLDEADEIIIARGDLGNSMPLWELPRIQKHVARICNEHHKPFMVVTQMLSSMEKSMVPTRAEVSDIYNAVLDGASSVMVTGETAVGNYPIEVIRYLCNTAREAKKHE
jgi:pyruvate kinase